MTFIRYLAIQIIAYGIDMGGFMAIIYLAVLGPLPANVVSKIAAGCFAFFSHQSFTFQVSNSNRNGKRVFRYFCLLAVNIPISSAILGILLATIDAPVFAKFISDAICVLLSFWISKKWIFPSAVSELTTSNFDRTNP